VPPRLSDAVKVAIMQPYFLPYIGYWQLIAVVDKFVILDDVNYINRGWINRNRITVNGSPSWMTLPLQGASQNKLISELDFVLNSDWRSRLGKTVRHAYSKAPNFEFAFTLFDELLEQAQGNLSSFLVTTMKRLCSVFGIATEILPTSRVFQKNGLTGAERLVDICRQVGATAYVNPPGGKELYDNQPFNAAAIDLYFLSPQIADLDLCFGSREGASLSILDPLMHNSAEAVARCILTKQTIEKKSA
jgi:hypothetical protein